MKKKLLALPALGAAAALAYGAAAALNVNQNAAPIQVGVVNDLVCAEGASVVGWGFDEDRKSVAYAWIDITDVNNNCDGNWLYVTPLDGAGNRIDLIGGGYATGRVVLGQDQTDREDDVSRYQVFFGTNRTPSVPGLVDAVELKGVQLAIDQGHGVGRELP